MPSDQSQIGDRLQRLRKDAGFSQAAVARRLEVTEKTIARWEAGQVEGIALSNAAALATLYGVSLDEFARLLGMYEQPALRTDHHFPPAPKRRRKAE